MAAERHAMGDAAQHVTRGAEMPALTPARETAQVPVIRDARATALILV